MKKYFRKLKAAADELFVPVYLLVSTGVILAIACYLKEYSILAIAVVPAVLAILFFLKEINIRRGNIEYELRRRVSVPKKFALLFAVRKNKKDMSPDWYCIDKATGKAVLISGDSKSIVAFNTVRDMAKSKHACCFLMKEMKKSVSGRISMKAIGGESCE